MYAAGCACISVGIMVLPTMAVGATITTMLAACEEDVSETCEPSLQLLQRSIAFPTSISKAFDPKKVAEQSSSVASKAIPAVSTYGDEIMGKTLGAATDMVHKSVAEVMSLTLGFMAIGMLGTFLGIFMVSQRPVEHAHICTWAMLSFTISVFCCSLAAHAAFRFGDSFDRPNTATVSVGVGWSCAFFAAAQFLPHLLAARSVVKAACATLGANLAGFIAIHTIGDALQLFLGDRATTVSTSVVIGVAFGVWLVLLGFCTVARVLYVYLLRVDVDEESEDDWWRPTRDFVGLTAGFLVSVVSRFYITGVLPPSGILQRAPRNTTGKQVGQLYFASLSCVSVAVAIQIWQRKLAQQGVAESQTVLMIQHVLVKSKAWCMLFAADWLFTIGTQSVLSEEDMMLHQVLVAMLNTAVVLTCVYIMSSLTSRYGLIASTIRPFFVAYGLVMGLSWAPVFWLSSDCIGKYLEVAGQHLLPKQISGRFFSDVSMTAALCVGMLPAWIFYVFPVAARVDRKSLS